jgi:glycosyltransferase involved in cell wall biosynthesis
MVSVCFITKNEERWLSGCLDQLSGLVSEVIVVDTGSTDRTVEIAKSRGAKVFEFKWTGNFSEARNFSLTKATQPWILKIDPDERIERSDLEKLLAYTRGAALAVRCRTRTYTNDASAVREDSFGVCRGEFPKYERDYKGYKELNYCRLFKKIPGVQYSGVIHEDVEPSIRRIRPNENPVVVASDILFHHYGLEGERKTMETKSKIYESLMEREVVENSQNWFAWYELGNQYHQKGDYVRAAEVFQKSYDLDSKQVPTLINLGYTLTLINKRAEGEYFLREALKLEPENPSIWLNFAVSRFEDGDFEFAQQCLQKALSLDPESFTAWRVYGQCLAQRGDFENAERAFRSALDRFPGFADAKVDLAILLSAQGKQADGKRLLRESLADDPSNPRAQAFLAQIEG